MTPRRTQDRRAAEAYVLGASNVHSSWMRHKNKGKKMKKFTLTIAAAVLAVSVSGAAFADGDENAASNRFAVLEGIPAQAMTSRDLESVVGGDDHVDVQLTINGMLGPDIGSAACNGITNSPGVIVTSSCPSC